MPFIKGENLQYNCVQNTGLNDYSVSCLFEDHMLCTHFPMLSQVSAQLGENMSFQNDRFHIHPACGLLVAVRASA